MEVLSSFFESNITRHRERLRSMDHRRKMCARMSVCVPATNVHRCSLEETEKVHSNSWRTLRRKHHRHRRSTRTLLAMVGLRRQVTTATSSNDIPNRNRNLGSGTTTILQDPARFSHCFARTSGLESNRPNQMRSWGASRCPSRDQRAVGMEPCRIATAALQ